MENARLFKETQEALERQTVTADILRVIASSPANVQPVFVAIAESAKRLLGSYHAVVTRVIDDTVHLAAFTAGDEEGDKALQSRFPMPLSGPGPNSRAARTGEIERVTDTETYLDSSEDFKRAARARGFRSVLVVPMLRNGVAIGTIATSRRQPGSFADKEINLLRTFADQAVIAIENARLFNETKEALEQQTATADVLKAISSSLSDLKPVFETIGQRAEKLCNAEISAISVLNDDQIHMASIRGTTEEGVEVIRRAYPMGRDGETLTARAIRYATVCHVPDVLNDPLYPAKDAARAAKYRAALAVPMIREGEVIGAIFVARQQPGVFTDAQVQLLKTFADQAVIAIENARLFDELRERQAELARSVDELTATGDVLKIISRSSVDLEKVLDTLVETVARLCRADLATMYRRRDDVYHMVAGRGFLDEAKEFILAHPMTPDRGSITGRVASERRAIHVPDVLQDPEYTYSEQKLAGNRTMLGIPLLRGDELIGIFGIHRTHVEPFTDKEIELATSFADQAVIAIENARLFDELRDRQAELRVTFDNMGDGVVMFDAAGRLTAWNRNFEEILELPETFLAGRPTFAEYFRYLADRGEYVSADLEDQLSRTVEDTRRELRFERTRPDGRVIEVRRNPVPGGGFVLIYADITTRKQAEEAIRAARDAAETALRELQKTQASLVHAQKMAALGQLTAGIAHEIKNPLNFVNNFAGLSVELLEELKEAAGEAIGTLDAGKRTEILETIRMLTGNLERIAEHGRRADGIVRGMLQHSRGRSGDWQVTDLNALVEESLNLAYHGARAQDQDFKVTWELDLDRKLAPIDVVSQDVSRVLLNIISNGFYAVTQRGHEGDGTFRPALKVATREFAEGIEIRVRDNGVGIPLEYREKLFQPFFTTKPTGEGTGLGLSISYEIVTQQHGGTITVDSQVGDFTEFTVWLPRRSVARETA
jgi:PAS domain S-box-containing protein